MLACLTAPRPPQHRTTPLAGLPEWTLRRATSAAPPNANAARARQPDGFWLSPPTVQFLTANPQGFTTELLRCDHHHDGRSVLLTAQAFTFRATKNVSHAAGGPTSRYDFRRRLLAPFSFNILAIGQLLTSGPYAQAGVEHLSPAEAADLQDAAARTLMAADGRYLAVLLKDTCPAEGATAHRLGSLGYNALPVDPVLEVSLPGHWKRTEDYLLDLTSKYRVRYRRARSKMEGLTSKPLSPADVSSYRTRIHELYRTTSTGASYNAAELSETYFPWLARRGTNERSGPNGAARYPTYFVGYFDGDELIGFTSAIRNGPVLHAHYLGLEERYKQHHHLYHNMLYDLLERAIALRVDKLDYGRTALEIKSSVGAKPVHYACLVKARSPVLNYLIPRFTPAVYTPTPWTPRNPFKVIN